jgi:RNA polymerase sigma-70 factor (sigma-E family)
VQSLVVTRVRSDAASDEFTQTYAAHHAEALRLAYLLCGDTSRAEDAVADAFVKVYRQMQRGNIEHPRAYLRRAVVNEINSRFRRLALERRQAAKRSGDDRGLRDADEQITDRDEVFTALRHLPARQRQVVVLRFYEDLAEKDIAEVMGISVGTVKSTLHRGLERLRSLVGDEVV